VVTRRQIPLVLREAERWDPDAFITIDESRQIRRGWMFSTPRMRSPTMLRVGEWTRRAGAARIQE